MTREPSFNAPTSEHTLLHLQETLLHTLHKVAGPGAGDLKSAAVSLTIAIDMHIDARIEDALICRLGSAPSKD